MSSGRAGSAARRGNSNRKSALEEIRRLREGGLQASSVDESSSRIAQYKPQEDSIYKTMSENEYEELVRQRRSGLPFVENDDGEMGYYDDGEEQFFESDPEPDERDDGDDDARGKKRSAGALSSAYSRRAKKLQRAKLGGGGDQKITNMFFSASAGQKSKASGVSAAGGRRNAKAKQDIDLDSMLNDLTSNPTESRQAYARPVSYSSGGSASLSGSSAFPSTGLSSARSSSLFDDDKDVVGGDNDDDNSLEMDMDAGEEEEVHNDAGNDVVPMEEGNVDGDTTAESSTPVKKEEDKPVVSKRDLLLQRARQTQLQTTQPTARVLAGAMEEDAEDVKGEAMAAVQDVPSNEVAEWWQVAGAMTDAKDAEDEAKEQPEEAAGSTDSLRMFWMDAVEVRDRPGKIYLIGKMKVLSSAPNTGPQYKSCCVVVNNLQRYMYLVPKRTLKEEGKEQQQQAWMQMHEEIYNVLVPSCITSVRDQDAFRSKLVERDYAFEVADMPRGKNLFVKVKYPAKYPAPPSDVCARGGKSFRRVCGAFTRPLENFLLKRKLLGPGWIEVRHVRKLATAVSFCHAEFETLDPKNVRALQGDGLAAPPLTVLSLSIKSVCNPHSNKHEVVALSALVETGVSADGAGRGQFKARRLSHFTSVRPLDATRGFPEAYAQSALRDERFAAAPGDKEKLHLALNERMMLTYFLARVQQEDPDVIVGHNLHKYALDLLISRVDHHKLGGLWSKLTRLRRGNLKPMNTGEGWNEYRMDDVVNGRLFCDTYVSAKELLPSQNNYSLSFLVETQLARHRVEVEMTDIPQILDGGAMTFVKFLRHTLDDAMFVLHLVHKLEALPLSKQLANLCGYLWTRTLEANKRAERIEYLLLHEFSRSAHKFIVPEKFKTRSEADKAGGGRRREAAYAGGMVFAPKKGLYDNFVVLLDFNSLYPSIIREYNICFTTVERQLIEDDGSTSAAAAGGKKSSKHKKTAAKARPVPQPQNDDVVDDEDADADLDGGDAGAGGQDAEIPPLPSSSCEEGVLPGVIKRLLESRKQAKSALKAAQQAGDAEAAARLDIRQKAIKLTANSMYGCLGFRFSRFYAKPIAALITSTGRQTLQRAKEVAEHECGYDVVYGDTDSIMVDSRTDKLEDAKRIGREVQAQCNKHFRLLELEVDYIFKTILLLNKKKYAALVLKEKPGAAKPVFEKEVKGLDLVRRDWCVLSKAVGNDVLDFILSGCARDDVVERIHEHLQAVAARVRSGEEPVEQFVITKSLNKPPEQYPDRAKQHHVQVALALRAQGKPVGVGAQIPYVVCVEEEPGSGRRAYHPEEVKRAAGKLTVDVEWYLEAQIHPPVNRLCAHIEGTSSPQLAHCLGLDTSKFSHALLHGAEDGADGADAIPSVLQSDADRFKACAPLELACRRCGRSSAFPGVFRVRPDAADACESGLRCPADGCGADLWGYDGEGVNGGVGDDLLAVLSNRLHVATRASTGRYYEGWAVCSDVTCRTRSQKQSLRGNGNICAAPGCRATVSMEYPDSALYTQLKFFEALFDVARARKKLKEQLARAGKTGAAAEPPALPETHLNVLRKLFAQAERAVRHDDYNWVKPSVWQTLFT